MTTYKYGNTLLEASTIKRAVVEFNFYLGCTDITIDDVTEDSHEEHDYGQHIPQDNTVIRS